MGVSRVMGLKGWIRPRCLSTLKSTSRSAAATGSPWSAPSGWGCGRPEPRPPRSTASARRRSPSRTSAGSKRSARPGAAGTAPHPLAPSPIPSLPPGEGERLRSGFALRRASMIPDLRPPSPGGREGMGEGPGVRGSRLQERDVRPGGIARHREPPHVRDVGRLDPDLAAELLGALGCGVGALHLDVGKPWRRALPLPAASASCPPRPGPCRAA